MDMDEVNALNKQELVAGLKKVRFPNGGNKSALKIRLRNHRGKMVNTRNEEREESDVFVRAMPSLRMN